MSIPRRTFLLQTGTAVAGLSALGCDGATPSPGKGQGAAPAPPGPPPKKPQTLIDALERMRSENKPGVAVRILENPEKRHNPGHGLVHTLNQDRPDTRGLFSEVVVVCLESRVLQIHIASANPNHDLVLFSKDGLAEAGRPFNYEADWNGLTAAILGLAHGPEMARLKLRAAAIRSTTNPDILAALDRLGSNPGELDADKALLLPESPRIMALLVQALDQARTPARYRALQDVIDKSYAASPPSAPGPKLPFGMELGPFEGGCGEDPCREQAPPSKSDYVMVIACGMARIMPNSRSFVRYLTR